jgi:hypothetical protein
MFLNGFCQKIKKEAEIQPRREKISQRWRLSDSARTLPLCKSYMPRKLAS